MTDERSHAIIGIDPSLTGAGVALIRSTWGLDDGDPVYEVHTFGRKGKSTETLDQRLDRIEKLVEQIAEVATNEMEYPDLALIETPAFGQTSGSHHDRSGLWWLLVQRLTNSLGILCMEVSIQTVKKYALGKGVGSKDEVMAAAIRRYPEVPIANNNESDAWILAAIGARLRGEPVEESLPQTHLSALDKLELPKWTLDFKPTAAAPEDLL